MERVAFDPAQLATAADPLTELARVRQVGPVVEAEHGLVAVTGYAAANEALRHPDCRSGPIGEFFRSTLPEGAARDEMVHRINFLDAPDHPRVRAVVNKAFTPKRVAAIRPWVERTTDAMIDELDGRDTVELLGELAHQIPSLVISELLGVPAADRDLLTHLSDEVAPLLGFGLSGDQLATACRSAEQFHEYLGALLDERSRRPADDLLSALLQAEEDGHRLDRAELLSLAATLYSAGHRTTRDLFANGVAALLGEPDHYRHLVDGRWSVVDVVGEVLRLHTPTLYVARVTGVALELAGVTVPAATTLLIYLAAANRDPEVFDDADDLVPGRSGPPVLSFAFGAHFCLGAALARSEVEVMLATVARRWPGMRLEASAPLEWHLRGPFHGVDRLLVRPR